MITEDMQRFAGSITDAVNQLITERIELYARESQNKNGALHAYQHLHGVIYEALGGNASSDEYEPPRRAFFG